MLGHFFSRFWQSPRGRQDAMEGDAGADGGMTQDAVRAALEEALLRFGKPRIFNTDQGSTFTAEAFTAKLAAAGVAVAIVARSPRPLP